MKKRLFSILVSICILLSYSETILAASAFTDIDSNAYYAAAVDWAVSKGITTGTSKITFSPNRTCTEAEILTFLWRANHSPEPVIKNPFRNVAADSYYYKPLLWAYENSMLTGSVFDIRKTCTRSTAVMYLWQAAGSPKAEKISFTDVPADSSYRDAIAWASANQVTTGTGDGTTFSPSETCTRAQIVTFLYRAKSATEKIPDRIGQDTDPPLSETEDTVMPQLTIETGGQTFTATLLDSPATRALLEQLPMTIDMKELNGNEKYYYLPDSLPTDSYQPSDIYTGDLMLYGSDCLVLFYKNFSSNYSYTRLGSIDDPSNLAAALGSGNVTVTIR